MAASGANRLYNIPQLMNVIGTALLLIVTLLVVGRHWNDYFDFFHVYFWQATLIAMIVSVLYAGVITFSIASMVPSSFQGKCEEGLQGEMIA